MISLLLKGDALGIVCFPQARSGDFEGPIFGLVFCGTCAVSSTEEGAGHPGLEACRAQTQIKKAAICPAPMPDTRLVQVDRATRNLRALMCKYDRLFHVLLY